MFEEWRYVDFLAGLEKQVFFHDAIACVCAPMGKFRLHCPLQPYRMSLQNWNVRLLTSYRHYHLYDVSSFLQNVNLMEAVYRGYKQMQPGNPKSKVPMGV
jgi:hypothetical protein